MAGTNDQLTMTETAEQVISRVLEPGEEILWAERPNLEVLMIPARRYQKRRPWRLGLGALITVGVLYYGLESPFGYADLGAFDRFLEIVPKKALIGISVCAVLSIVGFAVSKRFKLGRADSHGRWARSLSYAITDRRLLILEGDGIAYQFRPEELPEMGTRPRAPGYDDIVFKVIPRDSRKRGEARVGRELRRDVKQVFVDYISFKALPNAEAVKSRIEDWFKAHVNRAEEEVQDFVRDSSPARGSESPAGSRLVVNDRYGLEMNVPEKWKLQVRFRTKPFGTTFLDKENWQPLEALNDWNVVHVQGPLHAAVEVHLDETPEPITTYEQTTGSRLAKLLGVGILASEPGLEWGRFQGYSVTRRKSVAGRGVSGRADHDRPAFGKSTMLHDGRLQLGIVVTWPEESETLQRAVEKIVSTLQVD